MRNLFMSSLVVLLSLFAFSSVTHAQNAGQARPAASSQPFEPRDFTGVWAVQGGSWLPRGQEPPMTPWALAKYRSEKTQLSAPPVDGYENTDPVLRCEPGSTLRSYFTPHPIEFAMTPKAVYMLYELYRNFRVIYMDGRKHPSHPEGTWFGDSIGRWEGNTLVVDTINFNDKTWIDNMGHPHSDKLHLVERFTRTDHDHIRMDITIEDPIAYTQPWTATKIWTLRPGYEIEDYLCSHEEYEEEMKTYRGLAYGNK